MGNVNQQSSPAALESARLLRDLHALFLQGADEGAEADAIRDQMEAPWYAMTEVERERMGGLSEDLYALAEGGPPQLAMDDPQLLAWKNELNECKRKYLQGDIDAWLAFWRKPRPSNLPPPHGNPAAVIYFLQAQCWEKLGDTETAAVFRKAAEQMVMDQLTRVA